MLEMHNRESAEASSPELARAPLSALLVSGAFPPALQLCPPNASPAHRTPLSSSPAGQGRGESSGGGGVPCEGAGLGAEGAAEHLSRCLGALAGAAGAPRGAMTQAETGGAPGGLPSTRSVSLATFPRRGPHSAGRYVPTPKFGGEARGGDPGWCNARVRRPGHLSAVLLPARCLDGPEVLPGRGCRRRWASGRGTQGLTALRPGGAVKVHGLQMLFRPRCLPF